MVNNYPEYAAGVNFKKTDSNGIRHFYSAQVVADPSDETIESKLIKDGVVISEGGGGGSSDFSKVNVTLKVNEGNNAHFNILFANPETGDVNGFYVFTEDNVRYITNDAKEIFLGQSAGEITFEAYHYLNNPIYAVWLEAESVDDYTITGDAETSTFTDQGYTFYAVTISGDCTVSVEGSVV